MENRCAINEYYTIAGTVILTLRVCSFSLMYHAGMVDIVDERPNIFTNNHGDRGVYGLTDESITLQELK